MFYAVGFMATSSLPSCKRFAGLDRDFDPLLEALLVQCILVTPFHPVDSTITCCHRLSNSIRHIFPKSGAANLEADA